MQCKKITEAEIENSTNNKSILPRVGSDQEFKFNRSAFQHLNTLRFHLEKEGLFRISPLRVFSELILCLAAFCLSFSYYSQFPVIAVVAQIIACIHIVWWIHDAGHQAYFESKSLSQFVCEVAGQIFLGMPQLEYHFGIHRQHHRDTNIIHKDPALQTGPVTWHHAQREHESKTVARLRPLIWLMVVLPLTWPIMTFNFARLLFVEKNFFRLSITIGRWILFLFLFKDRIPLLIIPPLVAGFVLGLSASLNHFHMPIWNCQIPWLNRVFLSTQNISPESKFLGWLMGGLNCHVEHHLFPRMPSYQLAKASVHVRAFARELKLPYHTHGLVPSFHLLLRKLKEENDCVSPKGEVV